jgi:tetratricopeptide (TPR) repeat protein
MSASGAQVGRLISAGWAYVQAGNSSAAMREFKSALAIDPESHEALRGLCQSCLDVGDIASAEEHAGVLLRLAPESASAHRLKAEALRRRRRKDEALQFAEKAVKLEPYEPAGYHILALVHFDRRDFSAALRSVEEGQKVAPDYSILTAQKALIVLRLKGAKEAETIAEEALRLDLDGEYVLDIAARVAVARGQLGKARDLLETVLHRNANDEEAISLYLLTDPRRYRLLRWQMRFPYWRRENGAMGWAVWIAFWALLLLVAIVLIVGTHIPGLALGLGYRFFWQAQYAAHRREVKKHFAKPALKGAY